MKNNDIQHVKSSPYHPSSNELAERAVQYFKGMKKSSMTESLETRVSRFLFWFHLTPHSTTGVLPAELLLGRIPRSQLDLLKSQLSSKVQQKQDAQKKRTMTFILSTRRYGNYQRLSIRKKMVDWFSDRNERSFIIPYYTVRWTSSSTAHRSYLYLYLVSDRCGNDSDIEIVIAISSEPSHDEQPQVE